MLTIELDRIPKTILRGNSNAQSWRAKAAAKREMRELGYQYGTLLKERHPDVEFPLRGELAISIAYWNLRRVDCDNMLIGYKYFLDGLQDIRRKFKSAGVFMDDSQITLMSISRHKGEPRSLILIRKHDEVTDDVVI